MSDLIKVPIGSIIQSKHQLRDVDTESPGFLEMVDSIKSLGLLNPINVRRQPNEDTGELEFVLVDGAHRLAACRAAGFTEMPVHVLEVSELDSLFAQVIGNAMRVETKAYAFSRQLHRAIAIDPKLTVAQIAVKLGKPESYVRKLLSLETLNKEIGALVDNGTLELMKAIAISKLPQELQLEWTEKAIAAESSVEFVEAVNTFERQRKKALKTGQAQEDVELDMAPRLRKISELRQVIDDESGATLAQITQGAKSAVEAGRAAIQWAVQLDPITLEERRSKIQAVREANQAKRNEAKANAKAKLLAKRQAEVDRLKAELGDEGTAE